MGVLVCNDAVGEAIVQFVLRIVVIAGVLVCVLPFLATAPTWIEIARICVRAPQSFIRLCACTVT